MRIAYYPHLAPLPMVTTEDLAPGRYYVSVRDGERLGLLVGPFLQHGDALRILPAARAAAHDADAFSSFYSFGTVRLADSFATPGKLNDRLGLVLDSDGLVVV
mgnify:CR=1 FL=1